MPPPNTPEEGLTAPTLQPANAEPIHAPSPHPSSAMGSALANASQGESSILEVDYQSIEYAEPVDETLICPVCKTPFHSPITIPCGHTFCAGCIHRALETQRTCPIDRQPINKTQDYRRLPLIIKDQLDRLKVKCPNKGCSHVCPREHLEGHYERRCDFTPVPCPDPECSRLIARCHATPEKGCLHQDVACEFCHRVMVLADFDAHYDEECDGATAQCPECTEYVTRHHMAKHESHDCPERQTQCKWSTAGCKVADKRRIVQEHEESGCMFDAVGRLLDQRAEDRKIINDLTARLSCLETDRNRRRERRSRSAGISGAALPSVMSLSSNVTSLTIDENAPLFSTATSDAGAGAGGSPEDYLLAQFERLEGQLEELRKQVGEWDARQALNFMQHTTRLGEQLAELASKVGVLNMHTTWLMNMQRNQQQRAGATAGPSSSGMSHASDPSSSTRPGSSSDSGAAYQGGSRRHSDGRGETLTRL